MCFPRGLLAASLCILISLPAAFGALAPEPLGRANASVRRSPERLPTFVELSVFEGESISADRGRKARSSNRKCRVGAFAKQQCHVAPHKRRNSRGPGVGLVCTSRRGRIRACKCMLLTCCCVRRRINQPRRACGSMRDRRYRFLPFGAICCLRIETSHESYRKAETYQINLDSGKRNAEAGGIGPGKFIVHVTK